MQAAHAKQVKELAAAQDAVAKEQARLEALQQELEDRRADLVAQVCAPGCTSHSKGLICHLM